MAFLWMSSTDKRERRGEAMDNGCPCSHVKAGRQWSKGGSFLVCFLFCITVATPAMRVQAREQRKTGGYGLVALAAPFVVEVRDDLLTVKVQQLPLEQVLKEVAQQSGISLRIQGSLAEPVSVVFENLPLDDGVKRLLKDRNFVLIYSRGPAGAAPQQLTEVLVFSTTPATPASTVARRPEPESARGPARAGATGGQQQGGWSALISQGLQDGDPAVRKEVIERLGALGDKRAVEPLIRALGDEDVEVRTSATSALEDIRDERAIEPLGRILLADADEMVRAQAAQALAYIGGEQALAALEAALHDKATQVRRTVVEALISIGGERASALLEQVSADMQVDVQEEPAEATEDTPEEGRWR
jgi:hypothetical protein